MEKDGKTLCVVRFLTNDRYEKIKGKYENNCGIKLLKFNNLIPANDDATADGGDYDNIKLIDKNNIIECSNNNFMIMNVLFNYKNLENRMEKKIIPHIPDLLSLAYIIRFYNVIFFNIDDNDTILKSENFIYLLLHILSYINIDNNDDDDAADTKNNVEIIFTNKNFENLKKNLDGCKTFLQSGWNNNIAEHGGSYDDYKKHIDDICYKQEVESIVKAALGGIKIGHILRQNNIELITQKDMPATRQFLNDKLKKCFEEGGELNYIEDVKFLLEKLKLLSTVNKDEGINSIPISLSPPLVDFETITIKLHNGGHEMNFDYFDEEMNFEITCKGGETCIKRYLPVRFFSITISDDQPFFSNLVKDLFRKLKPTTTTTSSSSKKDILLYMTNKEYIDEITNFIFGNVLDALSPLVESSCNIEQEGLYEIVHYSYISKDAKTDEDSCAIKKKEEEKEEAKEEKDKEKSKTEKRREKKEKFDKLEKKKNKKQKKRKFSDDDDDDNNSKNKRKRK